MAETAKIESWDEHGNPVSSPRVDTWDESGNPIESPIPLMPSHRQFQDIPGLDHERMTHALVSSHTLGIPASVAYQNKEQILEQTKSKGSELSGSMSKIASDMNQGWQSSIFGMMYRNKLPNYLQNKSNFDEFVSGITTMVADSPFYIFGGLAGGVAGSEAPAIGTAIGAGMGAFAVPDAVRKSVVLGIQKGDIKSFGDLMERTIETTYAGAKGMLLGRV